MQLDQALPKPGLLVIINRFIIGGHTSDLLPSLKILSKDFDILILYGRKDADEKDISGLLKQFPFIKSKYISTLQRGINIINDIRSYFIIGNIIKNFQPSIVHTHGSKSGVIGRIAAYNFGTPIIIHTFHGNHFRGYFNRFVNFFLIRFERMLAKISTAIIAISIQQKKELTEIYKIAPSEKVHVIRLGLEFEKININPLAKRIAFRKKYNISDDTIAIVIAGRIVPIKNLKLFIRVASDLISCTGEKICFFVIGDGYYKKKIETYCNALNLSYTENSGNKAQIIFTSWIEDIISAMHAIDIAVLTSNNEGTPMSLIEAQACRKPVVATNVGGVTDTVLDNETGFLVRANDADAMVEKLKLLIENKELRKAMGENAAIFVAEKFSKQKEVEAYKKLYKSLINSHADKQLIQHEPTIQ